MPRGDIWQNLEVPQAIELHYGAMSITVRPSSGDPRAMLEVVKQAFVATYRDAVTWEPAVSDPALFQHWLTVMIESEWFVPRGSMDRMPRRKLIAVRRYGKYMVVAESDSMAPGYENTLELDQILRALFAEPR